MNETIQTTLDALRFGEPQAHGPLAVLPLLGGGPGGPEYRTLAEALKRGTLTITEVSEGGHVPELRVDNRDALPVLLLDGEELRGAKQNRVLNTTVLAPAKSVLTVPVSCTEQGRWSYRGRNFEDSRVVMARGARAAKLESVNASLAQDRSFHSNQGRVWAEVDRLCVDAAVHAPTRAMRDVFEGLEGRLAELLAHFRCLEGQGGLLAFQHGEAVGLDLLSRPAAFAGLFDKLLKSYAMDALLAQGDGRRKASERKGRAFLAGLSKCREEAYPSVGLGTSLRFTGARTAGSALVHEGAVVHLSLLANAERRPRRERGIEIVDDGALTLTGDLRRPRRR
jgi:hypothetical protein